MGLQLLLIDEKSSVISAFIGATRAWRYQRLLQPNSIYIIKNFNVKDAGKLYTLSEHKFTLQFIDQTVIKAVAEETYHIEAQKFRIRDFHYFEANADQRSGLFDVIGQVTLISGNNIPNTEQLEGGPVILESRMKDRVIIHLALKDGTPVRVTLWDNIAASFRKKIQQGEIFPTVLLVTTVNPKLISGVLHLNSMSSSRIFFDNDVGISSEYLQSLGDVESKKPSIKSYNGTIAKLEEVNIGDLYGYLQAENKEASFICKATIVDILSEYGWYYISCAECNKKLGRNSSSFVCDICQNPHPVGVVRYRVELSVRDTNNVGTFVVLNDAGVKLFGRQAADLVNESIPTGPAQSEETFLPIPPCVRQVIGKTLSFQVKISDFTFTTSRKTFSVSKVLGDIINSDTEPLMLDTSLPISDTLGDISANKKKKEPLEDGAGDLVETSSKQAGKRPRFENREFKD